MSETGDLDSEILAQVDDRRGVLKTQTSEEQAEIDADKEEGYKMLLDQLNTGTDEDISNLIQDVGPIEPGRNL